MLDCLVHWGVTQDFKSCKYVLLSLGCLDLIECLDAQKTESHVCQSFMMLSSEEYAQASIQENLERFGIKRHPSTPSINCCSESSVLKHLREKTINVLKAASSSVIVQKIYYVRMPLLLPFLNLYFEH